MKAVLRINGALNIEVEGAKIQDVLQQITAIENSIGFEPCGKCSQSRTFPQHRRVGTDDFYEIKCEDCGAVLQLGTHKESGTLYKKKMQTDSKGKAIKEDDKAVYLQDKGWLKYNKTTGKME